jgi:tetratricopeptide (TPR) repeat protein
MTQEPQLETLEAKGLIRRATMLPELEYLFRHQLVQDAAYGSLLKQERRELHGQVGEALEELYPERRGELSPVLGMHFEQAGEADKAIDYFAQGAHLALEANAVQEAHAGYERAASLIDKVDDAAADLPADEVTRRRRRRIEVELGRTQAGYSFRAPEETFEALEQIVPDAEELGDLELLGRVHVLIAMSRLMGGDAATAPEVKRSLDRIDQIGEQLGDPSLRAIPLALVGLTQVFTGFVREGVAALEEAVPLMAGRQTTATAFARGSLGMGYALLGEFEKADAAVELAISTAQEGDLIAQLDALIDEAFVRSLKGDLNAAIPLARQCVERAEETGASACMVVSAWILGDAFHRQGRYVEARDVLKRGADISLVTDRKIWRPTLQAWLGSAAAALGGVDENDLDAALATARSIGNILGEAGILGKRAEIALGRGDVDAARADMEASLAIAEERGLRPTLARQLRSWGEALRDAGLTDEATPILRRSLTIFEDIGLASEAAGVRTALALGGTKIAFG